MIVLAMAAAWFALGGQPTITPPLPQGSIADRPFVLPPYQFRNPGPPDAATPQKRASGNAPDCAIPLRRYPAAATIDPQMQKNKGSSKNVGDVVGDIKVIPAMPVCRSK